MGGGDGDGPAIAAPLPSAGIAVGPGWTPAPLDLDETEIEQTLADAQAALDAGILLDGDAAAADAAADARAEPASESDPAGEDAAGTDADAAADASPAVEPAAASAAETPRRPALDLVLAVLARQPDDEEAQALAARIAEELEARIETAAARGGLREVEHLASAVAAIPGGIVGSSVQAAVAAARERAREDARGVAAGVARLQAGRILEPAGSSALDAFRAVLARTPQHAGARAGVERIREGRIAAANAAAADGDFPLAERLLAEADRADPGSNRVQDASVRLVAARQRRARDLSEQADAAIAELDLDRAARLADAYARASTRAQGVETLRRRIETARRYGHFDAGQTFRDALEIGGTAPELTVVPHGSFMMGAAEGEAGSSDTERPRHRVAFERGFAVTTAPITVAEFRRFTEATGYIGTAQSSGRSMVYTERGGAMAERRGVTTRDGYDGRRADADDPVLHVSWYDASAYATWLSQQTGETWRLPSEAEYEYILRAGTATTYPWGEGMPQRVLGNLAGDGDASSSRRGWGNAVPGYDDGYWGPSPVRTFAPNPFGLHDMIGNVSAWTEDCWHDSYRRAPRDGSAWVNPGCARRVIRGASWASGPDQARSAFRLGVPVDTTSARLGIRLVRGI